MNKQTTVATINKRITWGNLVNVLFFGLIVLMLVHPPVKALLMRGLMKVGFFQPNVESNIQPTIVPGSVSFRDSSGNVVDLASLRGKVVFINFWATWCPPCLAELPSINSLYSAFRDNKNIVFLIADADNNLQKSIPFIARHNYQLPVYEQASAIPNEICCSAIPATLVIDKKGLLVFHYEGAADYKNAKFAAYLKKLIAD